MDASAIFGVIGIVLFLGLAVQTIRLWIAKRRIRGLEYELALLRRSKAMDERELHQFRGSTNDE